jgi:hypothetical protein
LHNTNMENLHNMNISNPFTHYSATSVSTSRLSSPSFPTSFPFYLLTPSFLWILRGFSFFRTMRELRSSLLTLP